MTVEAGELSMIKRRQISQRDQKAIRPLERSKET